MYFLILDKNCAFLNFGVNPPTIRPNRETSTPDTVFEVLRRWKRRRADPGTIASDGEKVKWQERFKRFMRNQNEARGDKQKTIPLLPNQIYIRAVDHALKHGLGLDLAMFRASPVLRPLTGSQTRYYVDGGELPPQQVQNGQKRRSCLTDSDTGERWLERGQKRQRALHTCTDCGAEGFPALLFLFGSADLRGTMQSDVIAHDLHNSVRLALTASGLFLMSLEAAVVANWTHGPWKADGNMEELSLSSADFWQLETCEGELWGALHIKIAADLGMATEEAMGNPDFRALVWAQAQLSPWLTKKGDNVKLNRWFSVWDVFSRRVRPSWHLQLTILLFMGCLGIAKPVDYHASICLAKIWPLAVCPTSWGSLVEEIHVLILASSPSCRGGSAPIEERCVRRWLLVVCPTPLVSLVEEVQVMILAISPSCRGGSAPIE